MKKETERLLTATQDDALWKNWTKVNVVMVSSSALCKMYVERDDIMSHIVSEYKTIAQNEYKKYRQDKVTGTVHWKLFKKGRVCM